MGRSRKHLKVLEARSVFLLREAYANFKSMGMLWSIGKDSTVLLWLARKAFFGHVPFPLIHIDTSFKIPEMIAYRDELVKQWNLDLLFGKNQKAIDENDTFPDGRMYVGDWKDGLQHGQGKFSYPDGWKYVGEWKDGEMWNGTDKNGNIERKYVNGEIIKQ